MSHRTLVGSSKRITRTGLARQYVPTAKAWALAYPAKDRIPAVCPDCGAAIAWGRIWFDAGTDTQHACRA